MTSYTNGYTGSYTITLPKYFGSGYGLSFIIYPASGSQTGSYTLYKSGSGYVYTELLLNNQVGNFNSYEQDTVTWMAYYSNLYSAGSKNSLKEGEWNTLTVFNNSGALETNFNGNTSSDTRDASGALGFENFTVNFGPKWVLAAVALTKSVNVSLPFSSDSNVIAYADFSDMNNPVVKGDATYMSVSSPTKFSGTTIPNVPDVTLTETTNTNTGSGTNSSSSGGGGSTVTKPIGNASELWVEDLLSSMMGVVNGDISTSGSTLTLTLDDIGVKVTLAYTGTTSCSVTYYAISDSITPIDIRRVTIWGDSGVETFTLDGGTLTSSGTVVDSTVYTQSNDSSAHFIRVNGIIYIVTIWISGSGARASMMYKKVT